jgi:DNA integrity scanning protein DisA with diadenylate cyclase activity
MDLELFTKEELYDRAVSKLREVGPQLRDVRTKLSEIRDNRANIVESLIADRMQNIRYEVEQIVSAQEQLLVNDESNLAANVAKFEGLKAQYAPVSTEVIG